MRTIPMCTIVEQCAANHCSAVRCHVPAAAAFELILEPIIKEFGPQLIIISAGFDAADGDFLGK
jgi:hypothetical protein